MRKRGHRGSLQDRCHQRAGSAFDREDILDGFASVQALVDVAFDGRNQIGQGFERENIEEEDQKECHLETRTCLDASSIGWYLADMQAVPEQRDEAACAKLRREGMGGLITKG